MSKEIDKDSKVYYFRINKELLKRCKRLEKIVKIKFNQFLEQEAIRYINKFGSNSEVFENLDFCALCGDKGDFEINNYLTSSYKEDQTQVTEMIIKSICPKCVQRIVKSETSKLTSAEQMIKHQLIDESQAEQITWDGFYLTYADTFELQKYKLLSKGIIILNVEE